MGTWRITWAFSRTTWWWPFKTRKHFKLLAWMTKLLILLSQAFINCFLNETSNWFISLILCWWFSNPSSISSSIVSNNALPNGEFRYVLYAFVSSALIFRPMTSEFCKWIFWLKPILWELRIFVIVWVILFAETANQRRENSRTVISLAFEKCNVYIKNIDKKLRNLSFMSV